MNFRFEYGKYYKNTTLEREVHDVVMLTDMWSELSAKQEATKIAKADKELGEMLTYYLKKYGAGETYKWTETIKGNLYREVWFPKSSGEFYKDVIGGFSMYLKLEPMEAKNDGKGRDG